MPTEKQIEAVARLLVPYGLDPDGSGGVCDDGKYRLSKENTAIWQEFRAQAEELLLAAEAAA